MANFWVAVAHNAVLPYRQAGQIAGWGQQVTFFALSNKIGSGKKLLINEVRVGDDIVVAKSATVARYMMHRVTGIISGPIEVRAMPLSDANERLPSEIRCYYGLQSPLTLPPNNSLSSWGPDDWEQISPAMPYIFDEPTNAAYAAATIDEVAGYLNRTCCIYTGGRNADLQRMTIRPGQCLALSTYDAAGGDDADFRATVIVLFEVANE